MKYINKTIAMTLLSAFALTSCIDEVEPTSGATQEQIDASAKATEALVWGMPAYLNQQEGDTYAHYAFGYGAMMHVRDVMTGDMAVVSSNYDHFNSWEVSQNIGEQYRTTQYLWNYYYQFVLTTNKMIAAVDTATTTDTKLLGFLGAGYAYRAMVYLDMARCYEYLPNDITSIDSLVGLTVPIVTEKTTDQQAKNNPRASREKMAEFIEGDLKLAEKYISGLDKNGFTSKTLPHLNSVYGLYARLYMWLEKYDLAAKYAAQAIQTSNQQPMTESACTDLATGFNTLNAWMWGAQQVEEDGTVKSGIVNWTSWMSPEATFGYASAGPIPMMDRNMYDRLSNSDFRKKMYKAPKKGALEGQNLFCSSTAAEDYPAYAAIKFRPHNGAAGMGNSLVGATTAYPLMRVEEMWFIYYEAMAHSNPAAAIAQFSTWMTTYRDPKYYTEATSMEEVIDEIVFQKRVELWGEGQSFFDIKRLNMSVTRAYSGTNWDNKDALLNTNGRPAWMNWVIVRSEQNSNAALVGHNNPDPSNKYIPVDIDAGK